jgi:PRTRC genetic system protein B
VKNITEQFNQGFEPYKALLIHRFQLKQDGSHNVAETQVYVESYDIGKNGKPINAHPLTITEMKALSDLLRSTEELKGGYLKSKGIMPSKILYVNQQSNGYAIWYTPPQEVKLFFVDGLKIPTGFANIPAMLWKASAEKVMVYALKGKAKPTLHTPLYHAPYLNIYANGNVCMGTVSIQIERDTCLEDFMAKWETYFFNSYFSHSINGNSSTQTDTPELWRSLIGTGKPFPQDELKKNGYILKKLIE